MEVEFNFKSVLADCDIYGLQKAFNVPNADIDIGRQTCSIEWGLEPDVRQYGIKEINIAVKNVKINIEWQVETEYLTPEEKIKLIASGGSQYAFKIEGDIELDSDKEWMGKKWRVVSKMTFGESGSCSPENCEIDFDKMTITVF